MSRCMQKLSMAALVRGRMLASIVCLPPPRPASLNTQQCSSRAQRCSHQLTTVEQWQEWATQTHRCSR